MFDMPGEAKEETRTKELRRDDGERNVQSPKGELNARNENHASLSKRKASNSLSEGNVSRSLKRTKKIVDKEIAHTIKTSKKKPSLSGLKEKESEKPDDGDVNCRKLKRRRRKKRKNNVELDEASRLQRRTRYLLIKVKLEQNLIDAYSTEGWKGQSREKIKPEKELQRAKKQILNCKLGIREAIHQLDLLSSVGRINDSAVAPDGSVHHEHIICAKCEAREALPDNDIILCDGTCNRAFHQKCLDPPLSTENIPQGDEGWFCKFCKKKMEILEATNAHLGTQFPMDSNWQDVFKVEAALPDDGNFMLCPEEEWPSDDSADDDYDPERIVPSCSDSVSRSEYDVSDCSSSFLGSLEDEPLLACGRGEDTSKRSFDNSLELYGVDSDEISSSEVVCRPRQRATVDYIKLYDEMFGKNAIENEQISDDEDWGPTRRRRKVKESDAASTLMTLGETENKNSEEMPSDAREDLLGKKMKRPIFRLPHNAVEKLRLVFAENELPERALRVSLSKQLGLEFEKTEGAKVSQDVSPSIEKESISETASGEHGDQMSSRDNTTSQPLKSSKKLVKRRNTLSLKHRTKPSVLTADGSKMSVDPGDDVSLKHLREKAKEAKKKLNCKNEDRMVEAEGEMERLCEIKSRVEKLQQVILQFSSRRFGKGSANNSSDISVVYVPVAEVREKR
ncbi:hypothetical protein BUALT_Bualt09G0058000 [Buddleja alternifolia]|uniref:PHD-type domain-containing protein n=1 Tax=Buddleja alternifolia TaxID=168488 RepID=A0AAV6X4P2_9LAMI|nr:hypothetical protein BUALT_Bualt09G0058000 [Buddleja alternifolia]